VKSKFLIGSLLAISTASFVSTATAAEVKTGYFVGVEIGSTSFDQHITSTYGYDETVSDSGGFRAIKGGMYLAENGRGYASIGTVSIDEGSYNIYEVGYDYLWYNNSNFIPFAGAALGYESMSFDDSDLDTISGITYGVELGAQYAMNESVDFEFGYKIKFNSNDVELFDGDVTYALENESNWYLGVNYNF